MHDSTDGRPEAEQASGRHAVDHLRSALEEGRDWPTALVEAMALWTLPGETLGGRTYRYLIGGEAFDWLVLAERLCDEVQGRVPPRELEDLLFEGRLPAHFDRGRLRDLLGVDKYRGYLNFYYGVTVEEALQLAAELEVLKRHASNGIQYVADASEEAFARVYRASKSELLTKFRLEMGAAETDSISVGRAREFTYWLFKYRLGASDKARIASDTHKGLQMLERMNQAARHRVPREGAGLRA